MHELFRNAWCLCVLGIRYTQVTRGRRPCQGPSVWPRVGASGFRPHRDLFSKGRLARPLAVAGPGGKQE